MKKSDLTTQELRLLMQSQGVSIRPSYQHKDYVFSSFTTPYPLKNKLDRLQRKYKLSRSKIIQMMIHKADEETFLKDYFKDFI